MALITLLNIYKYARSEVLLWQTELQSLGKRCNVVSQAVQFK